MVVTARRMVLSVMVAVLSGLTVAALGSRPALAQISELNIDNTRSSGSVSEGTGQNFCTHSILGTIAPMGGNAGESRNVVNIVPGSASPTGFTSRFIANLCTDSGGTTASSQGCSPGANGKTLVVDYDVNFKVTAPVGTNYRVNVENLARGEVAINSETQAGATTAVGATLSTIQASQAPGTQFGPGNLNLTSAPLPISLATAATTASPFNQSKTLSFIGAGMGPGSPVQHQVNSQWSAACSTPNNSRECGIRIGLGCTITGAFIIGDDTFGPGGQYPGGPGACVASGNPYPCCTGAGTGPSCPGVRTQANDGQFITVGLEFCGDGIIQNDSVLSEECDQGQDPLTGNGAINSCCTEDCKVVAADTLCRTVAGECDDPEEEVCTGTSGACPPDIKKPFGTPCTDDGNICSADICDGVNADCQHPPGNAGTECRASLSDDCDPAEFCTGTSTACPDDFRWPITTSCTSDGNPCTVDHCDPDVGVCVNTPGNVGAVCRAATDECDAAELCTGSDASCPGDAVKPDGTPCTEDGKLCTLDKCDGASKECQHVPAFTGTVCREAVGNCDFDEVCDGTDEDCPPDIIQAAGIRCRDEAGICDVPEYCDGSSGACPADLKVEANTVCRPKIGGLEGLCDVDEVCDGTNPACPPDGVEVFGTICRDQEGECDIAETCDGTLKTCPSDALAPMTVVCRDVQGVCDAAEYCTGTFKGCPVDLKDPEFTNCRQAFVTCDVDEYCDGVGDDCPIDEFAPPSVICRESVGICDVDELCTGTSSACPPDAFKNAATICRGLDGDCDVAENCTGTSAFCPADGFLPATHLCRAAGQDDCDVDDYCPGDDAACPPDAKRPDGSLCAGTNPNTCLNGCVTGVCVDACPGNGDINTPGCPVDGSVPVPFCCGNGLIEGGEQCDDGNQLSGDTCPSLPSDACQIAAVGALIRGDVRKPAIDKHGCQVEFSVLNPPIQLDRFGLPSMVQVCEDQDPACDLDPRPGRCRFHVVLCLNNQDPNIPVCIPQGLNSLKVETRLLVRKGPQLELAGGNVSQFLNNSQRLFDPSNPTIGFGTTPPLLPTQEGVCSGGMLIDIYAASPAPRLSSVTGQIFRITSKNNRVGSPQRSTAKLRLICKARALP